jgi:hypothetical protein
MLKASLNNQQKNNQRYYTAQDLKVYLLIVSKANEAQKKK